MNFLAHAYLSFGEPEILVGNMISDFVKGKSRFNYPEGIAKGIMYHRQIDAYTDCHPATAKAKEIFRPDYRLYSGAVTDVLYDHFLASDEEIFSDSSLMAFSKDVYEILEMNAHHLPLRFAAMFPYMKSQNWLYNYRYRDGLKNSLKGLIRRAVYLSDHETAFRLFEENHQALEQCYYEFRGDVKEFAKNNLSQLL